MGIEEFFDYKNQFMKDVITNPEIIRLLHSEFETIDNPENYIYSQVFPYEYIPETLEHAKTYICCDVEIESTYGAGTFLIPTVYVWIFTHGSNLRLPEGGVRVDKIASEISNMLNGSRYYGLGELDLYSTRRFAPAQHYVGKMMTFRGKDFNRLNPTGKTIPSNRKKD